MVRSCEPEWKTLGPALLEMFQVYLRVVAEAGWGTDGSKVYISWLRRLIALLYIHNNEMRTSVIHTLIALFERSVHVRASNRTSSSNNNVNGGTGNGRSGGGGSGGGDSRRYAYGGNETNGGKEKARAQKMLSSVVASIGATILLDLAEKNPQLLRTNSHLMEESYLHVLPNMVSETSVRSIHKVARAMALTSKSSEHNNDDGDNGGSGTITNASAIVTIISIKISHKTFVKCMFLLCNAFN